MDLKTGDQIVHIESGTLYEIVGDIKVKIGEHWYQCIEYRPQRDTGLKEVYARYKESFEGKFIKVVR